MDKVNKDKIKTSIKIEKRHFFRHYFDNPILHCREDSPQFVSSFCKNLSLGGLKFQSPIVYEKGDILSIKMTMLVNETPKLVPIRARVAWVTQNRPDHLGKIFYSIGVSFMEISVEVLAQIKEIVATLRIEE